MKHLKLPKTFIYFFLLFIVAMTVQTNRAADVKARQTYIIAVSREANAVSIIDAKTMQLIERIAVGEGPHEVISSADGRTIYVANYGKQTPGNSLSVIDLTTRKEIKRIDLGEFKRPHGLVERAGKIYFTAEANETVGRYDPKMDKVDWTAKTAQKISHMLAVSSDEKKVYTANIVSDSITVFENINDPQPKISQIPVGSEPEGISLSPDNKTLWIGHRKEGLITIIDTADNKIIEKLTAGKLPLRLRHTPNGKQVYVANAPEGTVLVYDAETRREINRIPINGAPIGIVFSPDGTHAYVTDLKNSKVVSIDTQTQKIAGEIQIESLSDGIGIAEF